MLRVGLCLAALLVQSGEDETPSVPVRRPEKPMFRLSQGQTQWEELQSKNQSRGVFSQGRLSSYFGWGLWAPESLPSLVHHEWPLLPA